MTPIEQRFSHIVELLSEGFVRFPEDATITAIELRQRISITVCPHADDYGKMIGQGGIMFKAMDSLLRITAEQLGIQSHYAISKPVRGKEEEFKPRFRPATNWKNGPISEILGRVLYRMFHIDDTQGGTVGVSARDIGDTTILDARLDVPIEVGVSNSVSADSIIRETNDALAVIFHAIGKAMGRNEVIVELSKADEQCPTNRR